MVSSSRWERDKNAALLELESRNRSLQAKLLESESEKEENARSSEVQKMQGTILQAINETFDKAVRGSYAPPTRKDVVSPVDIAGRKSAWEWQKNTALLELEHHNQQLQRLLKTKDRQAVISEQEKELLDEGYERGKECMRLYGQLRAVQGSAVLQAQRISSTKRLHAIMHQWRRYSKRRKVLRKAEHLWNRRLLKNSVRALALSFMMSRTAKKLSWIAHKHHNKKLMLRSFQSWLLVIKWKEVSRERVVFFNVLQKYRLARTAYGAWRCFLNETRSLERKAERFFLTHRWKRWTAAASGTRVRVAQAEVFCRHIHLETAFQTWSMNTQEAIFERARDESSEKHQKMSLMQKSFRLLRGSAQHQALLGRRLDKIIMFKTRRTLLITFLGWKQKAQSKKEVTIWRRMLVLKQRICLMQQAFQGWEWNVKQKKKARRLHSQQSSRRRKAVFHYWRRLCDQRKLRQQRMCHMQQRRHYTKLKDIFHLWLMHVEESRRWLLQRDAELLQSQLELSRQELHGAEDAQAELTRLVKSLEMEKGTMEQRIQAVNFRMPAWTSGFLDAELRWRLPEATKGTAPSARAGHVAVAVSLRPQGAGPPSHIIVAGGYDGYSILNDVYVFDEVQKIWRTLTVFLGPGSAFPPPVRHHTACWHQGRIVLFGGFDGTRDSADLSILTLAHDGSSGELSQPEARIGIKPGPMSQHSSCLWADRNLMLVFGGYRSGVGHLNELWTLDLQWMEWHSPEYCGEAPAARRGHAAAIVGIKMYIFGGFDGKSNLTDFYALDLKTMYWQPISAQGQAPSPRRHHSMAALGRHLVVYGGYNGEDYLNDVYSYDTEACFWKRWTVMKPSQLVDYGRSMHTMVISGQQLVVLGGVHAHGPLLDMVYLENGAAVDGLELERQLAAAKNRVQKLEEQVAVSEATLQQKVADLALAYSKISQCQVALKVEAKERKLAVSGQRVLIQKLKKTRQKSSLW